MTVKELKSYLEFFNDDLEVVIPIQCQCGITQYAEPIVSMDELIGGDEAVKLLSISPDL